MKFVPHNYQKYTIDEIIKRKIIWLNLKMGLGKTICTLEALNYWLNTLEVTKILVIAPLRVCRLTWLEEMAKFDDLRHIRVSFLVGSLKERIKELNKASDVYIINQDNIVWLVDYMKTNNIPFDFDCLVIDESSNFKTYSSKRFKYLKNLTSTIQYKILLTGTPMPNGYMDLWSQCYLLDGGIRLGKYITHYKNEYFYPTKTNYHGIVYEWSLKKGSEELIKNKIKDLTVSFDLESIKMPERIDNVVTVNLDDNTLKNYRAFKNNYLINLSGVDITAVSAGVLTNKLLQFANGAIYDELKNIRYIHDKKIIALKEIIIKHAEDNILVFYNFNHDLMQITKNIPEVKIFKNEEDKKNWDDGKIKILLAHPKSMGHGLNMQKGGHVVVWYSMTYDLGLFEQANARLYRQGQKETVIFYYLLSKDTIDELVYKRLTDKSYTQNNYFNDLKN